MRGVSIFLLQIQRLLVEVEQLFNNNPGAYLLGLKAESGH